MSSRAASATIIPILNKNLSVSVEPLRNDFLPPVTLKTLWLLMGAVGFESSNRVCQG